MKILGSNSWQGFTQTKSGDGVITITGKVAKVSSGALSGVAQIEKKFDVRAGEIISVSAMARLKSGTRARMAISHPTAQAPKNTEYITSPHWQSYTVQFAVPLTHNGATDFVNVILGTYSEDGGEVEFTGLQISSEGAGLPAARVVATGKIKLLNGVPSIDPDFTSHGITSLALDLGGDTALLTIQTDYTYRDNTGFFPIVLATHDGQLARNVHIGATMDASGLGRVYVKFSDAAGTLINMSTVTSLAFNFAVLA